MTAAGARMRFRTMVVGRGEASPLEAQLLPMKGKKHHTGNWTRTKPKFSSTLLLPDPGRQRVAAPYKIYTGSTAQGGGGSFKNGKPIGEVSWCDAKMAERTHWWIERWLSVSPFLSLFLSFSLCLSFAIYLQSYLSSHLPIYLSIHVSIDRFVYSPIY